MTAIAAARRWIRATARRAQRRDEGFTLVAVVAVAAVVLLLAATVITAAVRSDGAAGRDRGRTQALAAAEAGLDDALARLSAIGPDTQASLCQPFSTQIWSSPGRSTVTVTPAFFTAAGPVLCGAVTRDTVLTKAEITSSAEHVFGGSTARRAIQAVVNLGSSPGDPSAIFPSTLFSDRSFSGGGNLTSSDGDIYTNNDFLCDGNAGQARSSIIAQGKVLLSGNCKVGVDVLSGGSWSCTGNAEVGGNVLAAGAVVMEGNCKVAKNLAAAGTYTCRGSAMGGDVSSAGAGMNELSGNCSLKGSATFAGVFSLSGNAEIKKSLSGFGTGNSTVSSNATVADPSVSQDTVTGDVASVFRRGVAQRTTPTTPRPVAPNAPPRQEMPVLRYVAADATGMGSTAPAPTSCTVDGSLKFTTDTVIDARRCNPLTLTGNTTIQLGGDLTIYASSVRASGNVEVTTSGRGGKTHNLRIIVPARDGASNVCAAGGGNIDLGGNVTFGNKVDVFLYSPGTIRLSGNISLNGAVYACQGDFSGNASINYSKSALPSVSGPAGTGYTTTSIAKVDVSGR